MRDNVAKMAIRFGAYLATRRPVPKSYSLSSGDKVEKNFTYFFTYFFLTEDDLEATKFLVLEKPTPRGLIGRGWPQQGSTAVCICLPYHTIGERKFEIKRIYGTIEVKYTSLWSYIFGELTLRHIRQFFYEWIRQTSFNRSFRFSAERMDVLRKIVDWKRASLSEDVADDLSSSPFTHIYLYSEVFTNRAWGLDQPLRYLAELRFVLDSLVSSGELDYRDHRYFLNGKALQTLSDFESENRRHRDLSLSSWAITWLTLVIAIASVVSLFF